MLKWFVSDGPTSVGAAKGLDDIVVVVFCCNSAWVDQNLLTDKVDFCCSTGHSVKCLTVVRQVKSLFYIAVLGHPEGVVGVTSSKSLAEECPAAGMMDVQLKYALPSLWGTLHIANLNSTGGWPG